MKIIYKIPFSELVFLLYKLQSTVLPQENSLAVVYTDNSDSIFP